MQRDESSCRSCDVFVPSSSFTSSSSGSGSGCAKNVSQASVARSVVAVAKLQVPLGRITASAVLPPRPVRQQMRQLGGLLISDAQGKARQGKENLIPYHDTHQLYFQPESEEPTLTSGGGVVGWKR